MAKKEEPKLNVKGMETSLVTQTEEITKLVNKAVVKIENDEDYTAAMTLQIEVKERRKKAEDFFKGLMAPLMTVVAGMKIKISDALAPIIAKEEELNKAIVEYALKKEQEAEEEKRIRDLELAARQAEHLEQSREADEPVMPLEDEAPAPLNLSSTPAIVKTATHTGGLANIPKWKLEKHPEITSDTKEDIYLDDPRAEGIDKRLFKLDRGRVTTWNKSKVKMEGIVHYYGKTTTTAARKS